MVRSFNRNETKTMDARYMKQQEAIKEVCRDLNLIVYYPNYHADKKDNNTVIIYTKEGHEFNEKLSKWASVDDEKGRVCCLENTNSNGMFDLNWMNHGKINMRYANEKEQIEKFIKECLANFKG